jgi:hypothetical protein
MRLQEPSRTILVEIVVPTGPVPDEPVPDEPAVAQVPEGEPPPQPQLQS